jgi:peptidoglycan/LPS O-acetylase OafA/YrhL
MMDPHAASRPSLDGDESTGLLEEKLSPDPERDADLIFAPTMQRKLTSYRSALAHRVCSIPYRSYVLRAAIFLLPSFLQPRLFTITARNSHRPCPTAYLDGIRGLAALFVVFCHYSYTCFVIAEGWGYKDRNHHFLRLPIIRLLYSGEPMVAVLFVVSGYALSVKPLRLMRARSVEGLAKTVGSMVFRRGIRLFVPPAVSTLLVVAMLRVGLYEWTREFSGDEKYIRNVKEYHYPRLGTTGEQVADWAWAMFNFVHVWDWQKFGGSTGLDPHLWTIPVEYRASMVLFVVLVGTAELKTCVRFGTVVALMCFAYRSDRWEMLLFFAGMLLAEWDLIRGAHEPTSSPLLPINTSVSPSKGRRKNVSIWIRTALGLPALYLLSQPYAGYEATPGWVFLSTMIPKVWSDKYRYFQCVGAMLFVLCVSHSPTTWQRVFNSRLVQYLGKISYAIYLMHGPVLHTFGYAIQRWAWGITGVEGVAYNWGFGLATVFVVPLVVWAADVFWRMVDAPVVRFGRWFEGICSAKNF